MERLRLHAEMRAAGAQTVALKRKGQEASKLQAASNCELLRQAAQLPEKRPEAEPGSDSFSHSLLCCLRDLVRGYKPTRFEEKWLRKRRSKACGEWDHNPTTGYVNESFYVDAVRDPTSWRSVMEQVESLFRTSATRQVTLSEGHEGTTASIDWCPGKFPRSKWQERPLREDCLLGFHIPIGPR